MVWRLLKTYLVQYSRLVYACWLFLVYRLYPQIPFVKIIG